MFQGKTEKIEISQIEISKYLPCTVQTIIKYFKETSMNQNRPSLIKQINHYSTF